MSKIQHMIKSLYSALIKNYYLLLNCSQKNYQRKKYNFYQKKVVEHQSELS